MQRLCVGCTYPCSASCPSYEEEKTSRHCSFCGYGIFAGDEYVENGNGKLAHYDCVGMDRSTLEWLGHDVRIMND